MTHFDRFPAIVSIPQRFRAGDVSLRDLALESGYSAIRGEFPAHDLAAFLRCHPDAVNEWLGYSQDKRTSDGWYLRPPNSVGLVQVGPAPVPEQHYPDLAAACAAFIIAELGAILDRTPAV